MNILMAMAWFVVITLAITFSLPRILDALLYYFDQRAKQLTDQVHLHERKLEVMKEQYSLQQRRR